jgi:ActR/RegA family two-component response regulator
MHRPKVLLVDDRVLVRQTVRNALRGFDCTFVEAEDGESALALLDSEQFDVIFLDLRLVDLPGLEVLRRARQAGVVMDKVIVLTGLPEAATRVEAEQLGVFRYLEKTPINFTEIRSVFIAAVPGSVQHTITRRKPKAARPLCATRSKGAKRGKVVRDETKLTKVLILDNDSSWLDTMARVLGHKFALTLTTSAKEACRWARRRSFDLVILDMVLVEGDSGLDVLSRMRRVRPDLRAIILTGHPDTLTAFESAKRGAVAYVSKSALKELPAMVANLLAKRGNPLRIFLSYSRADLTKVSSWYRRLVEAGFLPWMDTKNIAGGVKWEPEIDKAIASCDRFVFFASQSSVTREGDLLREVRKALKRQEGLRDGSIFFIPARLEDCDLEGSLGAFQAVDLFKKDGAPRLIEALTAGQERGL